MVLLLLLQLTTLELSHRLMFHHRLTILNSLHPMLLE
jgi:hypothetical protein